MTDHAESSGSTSRPPAQGSIVVDFKHITLVALLLAGGAGTSGFLAHSGNAGVASALAALQSQLASMNISIEQIKGDLRNEKENHSTLQYAIQDHEDRIRQLERRPTR